MYFLLSGEGPRDMGVGTGAAVICEGEDYLYGPMAVITDHIVEQHDHYSLLDAQCCGFVSEHHLAARAGELKAAKKSLRLPGVKQPKETRYFFNNARVLARIAGEKQVLRNDDVVAVLFRDSDDTASAGRGLWDDKNNSIIHGFGEEGFAKGVPMVPKPKSEAWLICGITGNPNHEGTALEDWSGNDKSPNSLKGALERLIGQEPSRELLCELLRDGTVDCQKIDLPKFRAFRDRLRSVL
ncbi:MAG: hypothetical protein ABR915_23930 [Thermoguttaceae bacterium]